MKSWPSIYVSLGLGIPVPLGPVLYLDILLYDRLRDSGWFLRVQFSDWVYSLVDI